MSRPRRKQNRNLSFITTNRNTKIFETSITWQVGVGVAVLPWNWQCWKVNLEHKSCAFEGREEHSCPSSDYPKILPTSGFLTHHGNKRINSIARLCRKAILLCQTAVYTSVSSVAQNGPLLWAMQYLPTMSNFPQLAFPPMTCNIECMCWGS